MFRMNVVRSLCVLAVGVSSIVTTNSTAVAGLFNRSANRTGRPIGISISALSTRTTITMTTMTITIITIRIVITMARVIRNAAITLSIGTPISSVMYE
jgi:hypothetical protein